MTANNQKEPPLSKITPNFANSSEIYQSSNRRKKRQQKQRTDVQTFYHFKSCKDVKEVSL